MITVLNELLTWPVLWRLLALVILVGFALGGSMGLASIFIPFRSRKDITYDNLDKLLPARGKKK